jgi:uncharacterized protein YneF (UPF0154 family)
MLLTMATTHPRTHTFVTHLSQWHVNKRETTFSKRLGMCMLEIVGVAMAMFILPWLMQCVVQDMDEVYELLGRRARSSHTSMSWISLILAMLLLLGSHVWLARLSYHTVLESTTIKPRENSSDINTSTTIAPETGPKGSGHRVSWARILSRIVIPSLLLGLGFHFSYEVVQRIRNPNPPITKNTVDMQEAMAQLYSFE